MPIRESKGSSTAIRPLFFAFVFAILGLVFLGVLRPAVGGGYVNQCAINVEGQLANVINTAEQMQSTAYLVDEIVRINVCDGVQCVYCASCDNRGDDDRFEVVTQRTTTTPDAVRFIGKKGPDFDWTFSVTDNQDTTREMGSSCEDGSRILTGSRGKVTIYEATISRDPNAEENIIRVNFKKIAES